MADYIPAKDSELLTFATNFGATAAAILVTLGLAEVEQDPIGTERNAFSTALNAHVDKQTAAQSATQTKNLRRENLINEIRTLTRQLQANPGLTDAMRADLGITIPASNQTPVGAPSTRPVLSIQTGQRLQHVINFQDEMTPTSRAKPAGVLGCEIFRYIGTAAPASFDSYQFLSLDTATPFIANFSEADGGKTAFYIARWTNRAGDKGSWSAVASATIVG